MAPTNQGLRQATVRAATGTARDYNGDWSALFDLNSIPPGPWNGRLLTLINQVLGTSYTEINGAMNAYAQSQGFPDWDSMGTFSLSAYTPEATALFAAMAVQPTSARKALMNSCISTIKAAGVWARLDTLWVLTAHDGQAGLLNWPGPGTLAVPGPYTLTPVGAPPPTFSTDHGYAGDGVQNYLASTYVPGVGGTLAQQLDNCLGSWSLTPVSGVGIVDVGNMLFSIDSRINVATQVTLRNCSGTQNTVNVASGVATGHTVIVRPSAADGVVNYDTYKNAVLQPPSTAQATTLPVVGNGGLAVLARNAAGTPGNFSNRRLAVVHMGSSLTQQNISDLYAALSTYLTALGN